MYKRSPKQILIVIAILLFLYFFGCSLPVVGSFCVVFKIIGKVFHFFGKLIP